MLKNKSFYVYQLSRPYGTFIPVYIGYGQKQRYKDHFTAAIKNKHPNEDLQNEILIAFDLGYKIKEEILVDNLTLSEAKDLERKYIDKIGRRDLGLGTLCNHTDGGEGLSNPSLKVRQKIREKITGRNHTDSVKKQMSEDRKGEKHPMFGKQHKQDTKDHWSRIRKGRSLPEKQKKNISEGVKKNWEKRRHYPLSDETREKRRQNALKQWAEKRAKQALENLSISE